MNEYIERLNYIASRYELPQKLNYDSVLELTKGMGSLESIWGLCNKDLSNVDLSEFDERALILLAFNDCTNFTERCNLDYKKLMNDSKDPGLGVSVLHNKGISGKGVGVAVIDRPILQTHKEFSGCLKQYILVDPEHEDNERFDFHGLVCAAFLCGNSCGVANGANLYYYAHPDQYDSDRMYWSYYFKALDMIIEHNKYNSDTIRLVSISAGFPRNRDDLTEKMNFYISELKKYNCHIIYSNNFGESFTCSSKKYGYSNDDVNCYCLDRWQVNAWDKQKIMVPSGGRTSPCNSGEDKYMYCGNQSCYSWAIPYLCGVYALALQCAPSLGYDDFVKIADKTKIKNDDGLYVLNPQGIIEHIRNAMNANVSRSTDKIICKSDYTSPAV